MGNLVEWGCEAYSSQRQGACDYGIIVFANSVLAEAMGAVKHGSRRCVQVKISTKNQTLNGSPSLPAGTRETSVSGHRPSCFSGKISY